MIDAKIWIGRILALTLFVALGTCLAWAVREHLLAPIQLRIFAGLSAVLSLVNGWSLSVLGKWTEIAKTEGMNSSLAKEVTFKAKEGRLRVQERMFSCLLFLVLSVIAIAILWPEKGLVETKLTFVAASLGFSGAIAMSILTALALLELFMVDKFQSEIDAFLCDQKKRSADLDKIQEEDASIDT